MTFEQAFSSEKIARVFMNFDCIIGAKYHVYQKNLSSVLAWQCAVTGATAALSTALEPNHCSEISQIHSVGPAQDVV